MGISSAKTLARWLIEFGDTYFLADLAGALDRPNSDDKVEYVTEIVEAAEMRRWAGDDSMG